MRKTIFTMLIIFLLSFTSVINNVSAAVLMIWPTDSQRVTSPYGPRDYNGHSYHHGIDIGAVNVNRLPGERVMAASTGKVAFIKYDSNNGGQGFVIGIDHTGANKIGSQTMRTIYAHLVKDSNTVQVGAYVTRGVTIAKMGGSGKDSSGNSYPTHLHFETRICTTSTCATSSSSNPRLYINVINKDPIALPSKISPIVQNSFTKDVNLLDSIDTFGNDLNFEGEGWYDYSEIQNMTREEKIAIGYLNPDDEVK